MDNMDFDVSIFVITNENEYIHAPEYDNNDDVWMFLCLTNERLNSDYEDNNSIYIYRYLLNEMNSYLYQWQITQKPIPNNDDNIITKPIFSKGFHEMHSEVLKYLNGYRACQNIMNNVVPLLKNEYTNWIYKKNDYIPAIMKAHDTKIKHNGKTYCGYVPAIGQMMYINKNILKVNETLKNITSSHLRCPLFKVDFDGDGLDGGWWSSTEFGGFFDYNHEHCRTLSIYLGILDHCEKDKKMKVLTLFAL